MDIDEVVVDVEESTLIQKKSGESDEYTINLDNDITIPSAYRKVYEFLRNAKSTDVVRIALNTGGGDLYTFIQLYNHLIKTKATTIAEVYTAFSAGAMIALSCDSIEVQEFGSMMIHDISLMSYGKMTEILNYMEFTKKWGNEIVDRVYKGFLSDVEVKQMIAGKELWFTKKQIEKRLKKWTPMRGIIDDSKS